jgi:hypothetical protein
MVRDHLRDWENYMETTLREIVLKMWIALAQGKEFVADFVMSVMSLWLEEQHGGSSSAEFQLLRKTVCRAVC